MTSISFSGKLQGCELEFERLEKNEDMNKKGDLLPKKPKVKDYYCSQ